MNLKVIGSTLILMGTAIGAGMLALPLVSGVNGFLISESMLAVVWVLMTITGLLVLEVTLVLKPFQNNFHSMAEITLGATGQVIAWITVLFLLYALTSAYISGASSLLTHLLTQVNIVLPNWVCAFAFTVLFGSVVYSGTRHVDLITRGLMSFKGLALIITMALLLPKIHSNHLLSSPNGFKYIWVLGPIFLTSFGFHTVIPSLVNYLGPDVKNLRRIIIWGAAIPFVIYTVWLINSLGIMSYTGNYGFEKLMQMHSTVGVLIGFLIKATHSKAASWGLDFFSNIAITTSFLGVTLGLFDFLADGFQRPNNKRGRFVTALITFTPPLACALWFQKGFLFALGFAALCVAILEVVLPALMVYKLRKDKRYTSPYRVFGGNLLLWVILIIGIVLIVAQVLTTLGVLPNI